MRYLDQLHAQEKWRLTTEAAVTAGFHERVTRPDGTAAFIGLDETDRWYAALPSGNGGVRVLGFYNWRRQAVRAVRIA